MSFIQAFMQQTVYLGLPDDSVRNSVVLFQLLGPTTLFFFLFFFLSLSLPVVQYVRVEKFHQSLQRG